MGAFVTTLLIVPLFFVDREFRIYFIPFIAFAFGILNLKKPITSLAIIAMSIGFPIYIRLIGRDATTLTTFLIFEFFIVSLYKGMKIDKRFLIPSLIIVVVYLIGIAGYSSLDLQLKSARMVVGLISGLMLLLSSSWILRESNDREFISKILLYMVVIQSLLAILQVALPQFASPISNIFTPRESVAGAAFTGGVLRGRGAIGDIELLSEWIAGVFPLSLLFVYKSQNKILLYFFITLMLVIGLLSTVTRGAIIALVVSSVLFFLLVVFWGKANSRIFLLPLLVLIGWVFVGFVFQDIYSNLLSRFNLIGSSGVTKLNSIDDLIVLLNRGIWYQIPANLEFNLFFGNGFWPFQEDSFSIHSLYLTIWYQSGVLGVISWFWIFIVLMKNFIISIKHYYKKTGSGLLFALFAGLIGMLLNEIKVEILRQECTIQFFLLFAGIGISCCNFKMNKPTNRKSVVVKESNSLYLNS